MNDRPIDHGPADDPRASAPTGSDDLFVAGLRARLRSATAGLEPQLTLDDVVDGHVAATSPRRTWARAGAIGLAAASLVAVLVWAVRSPDRPTVASPSTPPTISTGMPSSLPAASTVASDPVMSATTAAAPITDAVNILVVGVDNNACIDPDSPFAGGFGDRTGMGERSDTIMMVRLDPATDRAAVLSFPRDLWVPMSGRNSKNRINSNYVRDDPTRLIDTIHKNFGIWPDHFIQIDFCAFTTIVDALGGLSVPFEYPARDVSTGLDVPRAGCFTFDGDHALAYVRSRKFEFMDASGTWQTDGLADLGRISRQQDFLRRVLDAALDRGITDPSVARALISAIQEHVVVDQDLTISKMLEYVALLASLSPQDLSTFQIETEGTVVSGNAVLLPRLDSVNMQAVLALFRGETMLAATDGTEVSVAADTVGPGDTVRPGAGSVTDPAAVVPEENPQGIVPPRDVTC